MFEKALETQGSIIEMLKNSFKKKRLSHAYLFSGEEGTEKLSIAQYFACMLYCDNVCGECLNCQRIVQFKHANVFYLSPQGQNIKKEQVLALQQEFSKSALVDGPRIYIIDQADKLSSGAANSLLKFIEEPFNCETYGIFITNNQNAVLPTIQSRCQIINFLPANREQLFNEIKKIDISDIYARIIVELTNSALQAEKYANSPAFRDLVKVVVELGKIVALKKGNGLLYVCNYQGILDDNENFTLLLKLMLMYFMDAVKDNPCVFIEEKEFLAKIGKEKAVTALDKIVNMEKRSNYNVNNYLMLECFLLDIDRS